MRKLALIPLLALTWTTSASSAGPSDAPPAAPEALIVASPLAEQLDMHEAGRKMRIALRRARPKPPPQPEPVQVSPHLQAIAACESGGDPTAIGGGGLYRGKYQFSIATWQGVGGTGDPAAASEAEQDLRATILYERSGPGQWPTCGA
jgi:hypothetical protein